MKWVYIVNICIYFIRKEINHYRIKTLGSNSQPRQILNWPLYFLPTRDSCWLLGLINNNPIYHCSWQKTNHSCSFTCGFYFQPFTLSTNSPLVSRPVVSSLLLLFCTRFSEFTFCFSSPAFTHLLIPNKAHTKRRGLVGQTHYLPAWFFCTQVRYSCTSSGDPRMRGARWWMASGFTSSTGWVPVVARPPACSMM